MALIHPTHTTIARERRESRPLHPAWGLVGGFGLITVAALAVHLLFGLL